MLQNDIANYWPGKYNAALFGHLCGCVNMSCFDNVAVDIFPFLCKLAVQLAVVTPDKEWYKPKESKRVSVAVLT